VRGIGALLAVYGFLSAVLYFFEYSITILSWANKWQPAFGLIVGCVGMLFLGISLWTHKEEPAEPQQPGGPYATPGAPPMMGAQFGQSGPHSVPQSGPGPNRIPQQGPQFGQRPPQGPPPQGRPGYPPPQYPQQPPPGGPAGFGPQGGPPYGPRG